MKYKMTYTNKNANNKVDE